MATQTFTIKKKGGSMRHGTINFAAELNEQQLAAVTAPPGPALVVAGAGTGKTRTLTYRVAHLIQQGTRPWNILLLTFTNKAAREMLDRVAALSTADAQRVWGGTFHSVGNRLLQRHAELVGYKPGFSILDSDESQSLLKLVLREGDFNTKAPGFPKPAVIANVFSMAANTGRSIAETIEQTYPYFLDHTQALRRIHAEYARRKRAANAMDFDDLLIRSVDLLREHPDIVESYHDQFHAILVDEYQDTNAVQSQFVDLLAEGHRNLMVVGDDAQSIYSWRGADVRNILDFQRRYPDAKLYRIETNYRSLPPILHLANAAISHNIEKLQKVLEPARKHAAPPLPRVAALTDAREEAEFVAQQIARLHEDGVALSDMAVLYRAHFHSMELQMELTSSSIPFRITSGPRFFEQAHIKDVASFLKFAVNPRDEVAFRRCVMLLPGIGERSADRLWQSACTALENAPRHAGFQPLLHLESCPPKARKTFEQFIHTWIEMAPEGQPVPPATMIESLVEAFYADIAHATYTNPEARLEDVNKLADFATQYQDTPTFLAELALLTNMDADSASGATRERPDTIPDAVNLSTIHQAKGLEWKIVFLIGLAEGMFPSSWSLNEPDAIEEERRLFYVGVTRAMDELILSWPQMGSSRGYSMDPFLRPSRFLEDLPDHLLETVQIHRDWD